MYGTSNHWQQNISPGVLSSGESFCEHVGMSKTEKDSTGQLKIRKYMEVVFVISIY
jgi:hypothetical protein